MNDRIAVLMDAIFSNWMNCLLPPYGNGTLSAEVDHQTDCNRFVIGVVHAYGYRALDGMNASQIARFLATSPDWMNVPGTSAAFHASKGALAVAAWENLDGPHGHVAVVVPGVPVTSGKWGYASPSVPKVANVGTPDKCKLGVGANYAFGPEPKYYALKATME